jgi:DNA polymerase III alpha subunit
MESPAMRHLLIQNQPTCLENVIQGLALLRPGAARPGLSTEAARPGLSTEAGMGMKELFLRRRHGLEPSCALFPALDEVLGQTHGVMLYEDDGLRVIQKLTGLSASDADRFRKRISQHKTKAEGEILRAEFLQLCRPEFFFVRSETLQRRRQGQAPAPFQDRPLRRAKGPHFAERIRQPLEELWGQLAKFNRYSFCKSHAVSYGLIAWQAAWLKAHHPLAFWVSVLNNNMGAYPRRVYIEAIKRAGLEIRLPCVNRSQRFFHPEETAIRTGLAAISGVPEKVIEQILANRESHGPYRDFNDLRRRVTIGPKTFLALIRAGALDFTGQSRSALKVMLRLLQRKRDLDTRDLFDYEESTNANDDSLPQRLWDQWETLGFVIEVPLMRLFSIPQSRGLSNSRDLGQHIGRVVSVRGLVATTRNVWTEDERAVQFVTLEDEYGLIEVTLFAGTCQQVPYLTMGPYTATGVVEERFGALTLTAKRFVVDGA